MGVDLNLSENAYPFFRAYVHLIRNELFLFPDIYLFQVNVKGKKMYDSKRYLTVLQ